MHPARGRDGIHAVGQMDATAATAPLTSIRRLPIKRKLFFLLSRVACFFSSVHLARSLVERNTETQYVNSIYVSGNCDRWRREEWGGVERSGVEWGGEECSDLDLTTS